MTATKEAIKDYWEKSTPMKFDTEKWPYEKKRAFRYGLQDYMAAVFHFDQWKGKRVVEVGCGAGIDSLEFTRNGAKVDACDITDNACRLTQELSKEAKLPVSVHKLDGNELPFEDDYADLVYSYGVLHHIPDVESMLAEIHRVLKPGGKFMAMVYHKDSLLFAHSILYLHGLRDPQLLKTDAGILQLASRYSERNEGCPYTRLYTKDDAIKVFGRYFSDVTVSVHYDVIDTPEQRKVKVILPDGLELGWHLVVKGEK